MRSLLALGALGLLACAPRSTKEPAGAEAGKGTTMTTQDAAAGGCASADPALRATLTDQSIASFVLPQGAGRQALVKLAVKPDTLMAVGMDPTCPNRVRFAAFEGWIAVAGEAALGKVDDATAAAMASVQAEAIRTAEDASLWGLPPDVTASEVSRHLVVLGRRVLPHLRPLLDDARELPIAGSETSAIAALHQYRVSDLAAGLIAVIVGTPYQNGKTPAERDAQLAILRTAS